MKSLIYIQDSICKFTYNENKQIYFPPLPYKDTQTHHADQEPQGHI